jgi:hypothetical protein
MKRVHGLVAVCGLSLTLAAAMAAPPVVDRVPENALVTIVVPSAMTLQKNLSALATAVESPVPVPSVDDLLSMSGMGGGLDLSKSLAIVMYGPKDLDKVADKMSKGEKKADKKDADKSAKKDDAKKDSKDAKSDAKPDGDKAAKKDADDDDDADLEEGLDRAVVILPITKYADFLANFAAKPAGEGKVDSFASPTGEDAYSKDIGGGYAVLGSSKELVEQFTGKPGASTVKSRMGKAGDALSDSMDVVAIVNIDRLRPLAEKGLAAMEKQAKSQMEMMGQADQEKNLAMVKWVGETVVRDTQMIVGGVKFGSVGISTDAVGIFKPESYLATAFAGKGDSSSLLGKLPAGQYLLAGAMDLSSPGMKKVMKDIISRAQLPGGDKAAQLMAAGIDNTEGQSTVVGVPLGALAGIFTNTIMYTQAKDPAAALATFKDNLAAMNGQKVQAITYQTKYTENASKSGETPLDAWETSFKAEDGGEMPAQMAQAMPFLFGPQGMPSGYVAKAPNGYYLTYSKNTELMGKALGAAKGDNLSSDAMLKQSQEMLPKGRFGEGYVGMKGVLDLALPFAAMAGMTIPADKIPEKLPPIATSLSSQDGSVRFSLVVPAPVIKTGVFLGMEGQKAMEGAQNGEGAKPKQDKPAGQPKF